MARKLRPALDIVSDIGSLAFDLQHHSEVQILMAVRVLRGVNGPMFDWLVQVLGAPVSTTDYRQATAQERAMARGFVTLWQSVGVQDAEDSLYDLRNRAELLASLDEDDSREAQDNTPSLGPFGR